jgi:uncharacterized membrane protein SpoIIM required for sporulation
MRETQFISQNKGKWSEFEKILRDNNHDPEKITRLFTEITEDLSYARTFYPYRMVRFYLNDLSQLVFGRINKNRVFRIKKFWQFWSDELPWVVYQARKKLLVSFLVFLFSMVLGMLTTAYNEDFPRLILGDQYVETTIRNIEDGDPMAVYKQSDSTEMFLGITFNNIRVAFMIFIFGLLLGIGSVYILIFNGLMLGSFQYFFYDRGVLSEALVTVWQHGTLEISSIIIAGAAGITLGYGLVFPGNYSRLDAFRMSAYRGVKILLGTVPLFIIAGFIEGFITRSTDAPMVLRVSVIVSSLTFILFYFIWLPWSKHRKNPNWSYPAESVPPSRRFIIRTGILSNSVIIKDSFLLLKQYFSRFARISIPGIILIIAAFFLLYQNKLAENTHLLHFRSFVPATPFFYLADLYNILDPYRFPFVLFISILVFSWLTIRGMRTLTGYLVIQQRPLPSGIILTVVSIILAHLPLLLHQIPSLLIIALLVYSPCIAMLITSIHLTEKGGNPFTTARKLIARYYFRILWLFSASLIISLIMMLIFATPVMFFYMEFIMENIPAGILPAHWFYMGYILITGFAAMFLLFPFVLTTMALKTLSLNEIMTASTLIRWFENVNVERRSYGFKAED